MSFDLQQTRREYASRGAGPHYNMEEGCWFRRVVPQQGFGLPRGGSLGHVRIPLYQYMTQLDKLFRPNTGRDRHGQTFPEHLASVF